MKQTRRLELYALTERINPVAGAADTTFSSDGMAFTPFGQMAIDRASGMTIQNDGKILVVGENLGVPMIARFLPNGAADTSFSGDGLAYLTNYGDYGTLYDVEVQSTGHIVVCGTSRVSGNYMVMAARLTSAGVQDTSFGPNSTGVVTTDLSLSDDNGFAMAMQANDKFVVVGNTATFQTAVLRYNAQGILDSSFGGIGSITIASSSQATGVAVYDDGRIVISGKHSNGMYVARVGSTGILDTTFDGDGVLIANLTGVTSEESRNVALDANENILIAGNGGVSGRTHGVIVRVLDNGTLDPSFDGDGVATVDFQNNGGVFNAVTVDQDGNIIGAGGVGIPGGSKSLVARLTPSGAIDTTFAPFGGTAIPGVSLIDMAPNDNDGFGAVAMQADGKIIGAGTAGGGSTRYMGVVRMRGNDFPEPAGDSYTTNEDTPRVVAAPGLLTNDFIPDGVTPEIELVTPPAHGTLEWQQDGSFTYTPALNYNGTDSFQYRLLTSAISSTATVDLTITAQSDSPLSLPDAYNASDLVTIVRTAANGVLANDVDPDNGAALSATLSAGPSIGTLNSFNSDGSFSFTFPDDFYGTTSFTYRANNGAMLGAVTTVTLARNELVRADGNTLVIAGTEGADIVRVRSGGGNRLLVELFTPNLFLSQVIQPAVGFSKFTGLSVHLGDGDDRHDSTAIKLPTTVIGGLGNDIIRTGKGTDVLHGDLVDGSGAGDDTLEAGEGQSTVHGGGGSNTIRTGKLADTITVGDGPNRIVTGKGDDTVTTGNGANEINTEAGNDRITVGSGANFINGGAGNDIIRTTTGNNVIDAGVGNDDVMVQGGNNTILGDGGNDVLLGGTGNDIIFGGAGKDFVVGGLGADMLNGDAGDDMLFDGTVTLTTPTTDSFAKIISMYKPTNKPATSALLQRFTATADTNATDSLIGGVGNDWFWFSAPNEAFDMISTEPRNNLV